MRLDRSSHPVIRSQGVSPWLLPGRDALATKNSSAPGFTLLEIILAMFVLVLLVSGLFAIVGGTTQLADEMSRAHERDARRHSFAEFCARMLRTLPGSAQVRLRVKQEGNHYLGELALKNAPSPIGSMGANGMTLLRTEQAPDGYLRVVLEMIPSDESEGGRLGKGEATKQSIILLEGVAKCEWRFFNPVSREWEPVWNDKLSFGPSPVSEPVEPVAPGAAPSQPQVSASLGSPARRPGLVELNLAIGPDAPRRFVFWVPPASLPGAFGAAPQNPLQDPPPSSGETPAPVNSAPSL